jgi:hypothetical protein
MNRDNPQFRVVLLTSNDFFGCAILNHLAIEYPWLDVVAISRPQALDLRVKPPGALHDYVTFNGRFFAETYCPRLDARGDYAGPYRTFEDRVKENGIREFESSLVKQESFHELLLSLDVDLVLSCHFPVIVSGPVLKLQPELYFNIHPGLLPEYRGILCPFWAAKNGDRLGVTVHRMTAEIDEGPVCGAVTSKPIQGISLFEQHLELYLNGVDCFARLLAVHQSAKAIPSESQDKSRANYFGYPCREDMEAFPSQIEIFSKFRFFELLRKSFDLVPPKLSPL